MAINNIPLSLEEDVKLQGYKSKLAALRSLVNMQKMLNQQKLMRLSIRQKLIVLQKKQ